MPREIHPSEKDVKRFWSKVNKNGALWTNPETGETSHCWEWTAVRTHDNYGRFFVSGHESLAHRVAYAIAHGSPPVDLLCCHRCDNPPCCNPDHLFLGTSIENQYDMMRKGRTGKRGKRSEDGGDDLEGRYQEIRTLRKKGVSSRAIAKIFKYTEIHVNRILHGTPWRKGGS